MSYVLACDVIVSGAVWSATDARMSTNQIDADV